jgi:carbon monoxide dehydrogenase subunit G
MTMAIEVSGSVVISKPVAEVFAFVADHENLPAWTMGVKASRRLTQGPPATGVKYRIVGKLLGRSVESSYEVTAFEHDRGFEGMTTSPMFGFSETYRFEPDGAATRVSMTAAVGPRRVLRLLTPIMAAGVRRQVNADHRLKAVLEGPEPAPLHH